MTFLHGCEGSLTALFGGFRPGQYGQKGHNWPAVQTVAEISATADGDIADPEDPANNIGVVPEITKRSRTHQITVRELAVTSLFARWSAHAPEHPPGRQAYVPSQIGDYKFAFYPMSDDGATRVPVYP